MAALLMAVGFSVDFTSHIAYHYYKSKQRVSQGFSAHKSLIQYSDVIRFPGASTTTGGYAVLYRMAVGSGKRQFLYFGRQMFGNYCEGIALNLQNLLRLVEAFYRVYMEGSVCPYVPLSICLSVCLSAQNY